MAFVEFGFEQPNSTKANALCLAYTRRSKGFSGLRINLQIFLVEAVGVTPS